MNRWFVDTFLPSFGFCENKKISKKQADIFIKQLTNDYCESLHSHTYSDYMCNLYIKLHVITVYNGSRHDSEGKWHTLYRDVYYLTIKKDVRKDRENIKKQIQKLNLLFDEIYRKSGNVPELDEIENQIDSLEMYLVTL